MPFLPPDTTVAVVADCSESPVIVSRADPGESIQVISSLAGGKETCYKVRLVRNGLQVEGYVVGEALPAIRKFVEERPRVQPPILTSRTAASAAAETKAVPVHGPFEDFNATDMRGRPFRLCPTPWRRPIDPWIRGERPA